MELTLLPGRAFSLRIEGLLLDVAPGDGGLAPVELGCLRLSDSFWGCQSASGIGSSLSFGGFCYMSAFGSSLEIEHTESGKRYVHKYAKGRQVQPLCEVGWADWEGTSVYFQPDPEIFEEGASWPIQEVKELLRLVACSIPGSRVSFQPLDGPLETFDDMVLVDALSRQSAPDGEEWFHQEPLHFRLEMPTSDHVSMDLAIRWHTGAEQELRSWVNTHRMTYGGTHIDGFYKGMAMLLQDLAERGGQWKEGLPRISSTDVRLGFTAVLILESKNARFEETRHRLASEDTSAFVAAMVRQHLAPRMTDYPALLREAIKRAQASAVFSVKRRCA